MTTARSKGSSGGKASATRPGATKSGAPARAQAATRKASASRRAPAAASTGGKPRTRAASTAGTSKSSSKKAISVKTPAKKSPTKTAAAPKKPAAKAAAPKPAKETKPVAKTVPAKPATAAAKPAAPAKAPAAAKPAAPARPAPSKPTLVPGVGKPAAAKQPDNAKAEPPFRKGDFVVYPTHGVGKVLGVEMHNIAGHKLQLITIRFEKDRMTLRVPVSKAQNSGLRRLSSRKVMDTALATLKGRSRIKRTMWSRRAQEYEAKINSGDPVQVAEVVRDLHRNADQPDQSYSERQIYQAALDRLVREFAAIEEIDEDQATERLNKVLKAA